LGVARPKNDGKPWTPAQDKQLARLARNANVPTDKIAREMGRTEDAIRSEAERKDISLRPKNR
jgi:predicted transcriptional regulator